nr:hypothetical protein [Lachnospira eligens]
MNAKELETQHNLKKWAAIIKECRSSGMMILQLLEINNISKDQYYYWQRKLKETCIDTFERQAATFVELPVTKEVPVSTELTVTHTVCKNDAIAAVIKTNGVANNNRFGRKTEKMSDTNQICFMEVDGKIVFFNEAEAVSDLDANEPEELEI